MVLQSANNISIISGITGSVRQCRPPPKRIWSRSGVQIRTLDHILPDLGFQI